jgi:hypothetical protein
MSDKPTAPPAAPKPAVKPAAAPTKDEAAARVAASRGAQVTLDPDSDAALAARGAMGDTIEANTQARDADLIAQGFDPDAPSAHETDDRAEKPKA